jgi:hypothetical protein
MIDAKTRNRFLFLYRNLYADVVRHQKVPEPDPGFKPPKGKNLRAEFATLWTTVIDDDAFRRTVRRLLFIPARIPDAIQGLTLIKILEHLRGEKTDLAIHGDVEVTEALVLDVRVEDDSEGPTYHVKYAFGKGGTFEHEGAWGYDAFHAAMNAWPREALDAHWAVGNRIPCHYRKSDPKQHALQVP